MSTKIISCVGQKGGVGKTTTSIMLATTLHFRFKKKVVLLDVDNPQYSTFKKRQKELKLIDGDNIELYPIEPVKTETIKEIILKYYDLNYDYILIDFPGSLNEEMIKGLYFIEHVFIPFKYDDLEIDSTLAFYFSLTKNHLNDPKARLKTINLFYSRYSEVKKNKYIKNREDINNAGINILKSVVKDKTIYAEQYRSTVFPIPKGKEEGEKDFLNFVKEIIQKTK